MTTKESLTTEGWQVKIYPKVDPRISCPQSVLHLEAVLKGIQKGELICEITPTQ